MDITSSTADLIEVAAPPVLIVRGDLLQARKAALGYKIATIQARGARLAATTISKILNGSAEHSCTTVYSVGLALGLRGEFTFSPINHDPTFAAVATSGRHYSRMFSQSRQRWIVIEEAAGHRAEVADCVSEDLARWIADGLNAHR